MGSAIMLYHGVNEVKIKKIIIIIIIIMIIIIIIIIIIIDLARELRKLWNRRLKSCAYCCRGTWNNPKRISSPS